MLSSSDVFILSAVQASDPSAALRQAIQESGIKPARVQDLLFGWDGGPAPSGAEGLARSAGLDCPAVALSSSLRALFFAAQSILCGDAELVLVGGAQDNSESAALLLAGPAAVGVYNLLPLARLDARSLAGAEAALRKAELAAEDVEIKLEGTCGALLAVELAHKLIQQNARWGILTVSEAAMLMEIV
jgi:hypothetical protein